MDELSLGGVGGSRQANSSRAVRPVSPQTEDGVDIRWLGLQEARWAPTHLALGNFLREKIGEQMCYGATHSTVSPVTGASSRVMGISLKLTTHPP